MLLFRLFEGAFSFLFYSVGLDCEMALSPSEIPSPGDRARPLVFVSGCYDLLHSGHVAFFEEASRLGDLYVSLGNDANIEHLKHHKPMFPEKERLFMVKSIRYVYAAAVCKGMGIMDFETDLDLIQPDIFFVNEDGHKEAKAEACEKRGIKYHVAERTPHGDLTVRSSTAIKASLKQ